jgi:hypothetical protein
MFRGFADCIKATDASVAKKVPKPTCHHGRAANTFRIVAVTSNIRMFRALPANIAEAAPRPMDNCSIATN